MLIDLLNSANYIMVNKDAIRIFGLNTAVYCSELLNIYKKAYLKNKMIEGSAFVVDRNYIAKQTSLSIEDQLKCDINLSKIQIIQVSKEDKDVIKFDVEKFASLLSSEDIKLLDKVSKKVNVNARGSKEAQRERIILNLKESIICNNFDLLTALRNWIDAIMSDPNKYLSKVQIELFKERLDEYAKDNNDLALAIVNQAIIHQYIDCQWAINAYEKDMQVKQSMEKIKVRKTDQKTTTAVSQEVF